MPRTKSGRSVLLSRIAGYLNRQPIHGRRLTFLQRVRRWSLQTARVYEASILIVVLSLIRLLFGPGALIMALASQDVTVSRLEIIEILLANVLFIFPNDLWMAWSARQNRINRFAGRLYWAAITLSSLGCVAMILISLGILPAAEWYRRSTGARILVFGLMSMIYFVQTIAWYMADWNRLKRGGNSAAQRYFKRLLICIPVIVAVAIPLVRFASRQADPPMLVGPAESIQLDGVDDYLTVENVGFDAQSPLTLEAWIQPDKPHRGVIVSHGPIALTVIAAGNGNRFRVHLSVSDDRVYLLDAKDIIRSKQWAHIAMTLDGEEIKMYVNGQLQVHDVSLYDMSTNLVTPNATLPEGLVVADLWPGSRLLIGNIRQSDLDVQFHFSGRIGELRLNRSLFYHEEFQPESNLIQTTDTALLLHLRDGQSEYSDVAGGHTAYLNQ
jgi:eukaryotic-like serine/threonine-protein kinase